MRDLSSSLKVSRATTLKALEELRSVGLLESVPGAGTFVKAPLVVAHQSSPRGDRLPQAEPSNIEPAARKLSFSAYGQRIESLSKKTDDTWFNFGDIDHGAPPIELAPLATWSSLLLDYCRTSEIISGSQSHADGYPPALEALSAYLRRARSVHCQASQLLLFSSKQLRLDLIARTLIDPGDCVAVEEPGYPETRIIFESHGALVKPVPVDHEGLQVALLDALPRPPKLVYVTPCHQDPTGVSLSLARRKSLLDWARDNGSYVIEDDYDSTYHFSKEAPPSLQGVDGECTVYLGSLWIPLFPLLKFGFVVVPRHLSRTFSLAKQQQEKYLPIAEQVALAAFINQGHLERHIHRTRKILAKRRQALIYALTLHLRGRLSIDSDSGGMRLMVRIDSLLPDQQIVDRALKCGLAVISTARYYEGTAKKGELMILFSNIDPKDVGQRIERWAKLLAEEEKSS